MHLDISEPRRLAHIADTGSTFATRSRSRGRCMRAQFSGSTGRNPSGRGLENVCSFFFFLFCGRDRHVVDSFYKKHGYLLNLKPRTVNSALTNFTVTSDFDDAHNEVS